MATSYETEVEVNPKFMMNPLVFTIFFNEFH